MAFDWHGTDICHGVCQAFAMALYIPFVHRPMPDRVTDSRGCSLLLPGPSSGAVEFRQFRKIP
jgi:hypothetical protein